MPKGTELASFTSQPTLAAVVQIPARIDTGSIAQELVFPARARPSITPPFAGTGVLANPTVRVVVERVDADTVAEDPTVAALEFLGGRARHLFGGRFRPAVAVLLGGVRAGVRVDVAVGRIRCVVISIETAPDTAEDHDKRDEIQEQGVRVAHGMPPVTLRECRALADGTFRQRVQRQMGILYSY